jgi:hypothetical protein
MEKKFGLYSSPREHFVYNVLAAISVARILG